MANLSERPCREVKPDQDEPEKSKVQLNDLPELPFELILSYLSLEELIKARAVSRRWCSVINGFRPKSLCISSRPSGFIYGKSRWINGSFAENFISAPRFESFFNAFGQSILSRLKYLRLYNLDLKAENVPAFARTLNSFGQLEFLQVGLFGISSELATDFQLKMSMLKSVSLDKRTFIERLTLDAPRLQNVKLVGYGKVDLVHGESVEELIIDRLDMMEVKKLKNLKYLYFGFHSKIDSTLLSTLDQLKEIHLQSKHDIADLFQQKERYGRVDLMIFLCGCALDGPNDPAIGSLFPYEERFLVCLAENQSRLVKEIPLCEGLVYSALEDQAQEIGLLNRFIDLEDIFVFSPLQDIKRFLDHLKNLNNIVQLSLSNQPQELFDRLPDHCAIQWLTISKAPEDLDFLFKLKSLIHLMIWSPIDIEFIPKVFEELPFLSILKCRCLEKAFTIANNPNEFFISLGFYGNEEIREEKRVPDLNAVVQWISEKGVRPERKNIGI